MSRLLIAACLVVALLSVGISLGLLQAREWLVSLVVDGGPHVEVPVMIVPHDEDGDGILDQSDIVAAAREEVKRGPTYRSAYYQGGFPPVDEGVCTDVIWRAFKDAGYNLKALVDRDIAARPQSYPRVAGKPDPNIDFRRVQNLTAYFERYANKLTTVVKPGDVDNLKEWQPGDIVIFGEPKVHIAIVSDNRRRDGVPLMIHNSSPTPREDDALLYWHENISPITHHFRWPRL